MLVIIDMHCSFVLLSSIQHEKGRKCPSTNAQRAVEIRTMWMDCLKIQASEAGDLRRVSLHVQDCRYFAHPLSSQVITACSCNAFHSLYAEGGPRPVKAQFCANEARFSAWRSCLGIHSGRRRRVRHTLRHGMHCMTTRWHTWCVLSLKPLW
jgi:hypothetical protein